jgi:hypothetical protein
MNHRDWQIEPKTWFNLNGLQSAGWNLGFDVGRLGFMQAPGFRA